MAMPSNDRRRDWTLESYIAHNETLRANEKAFDEERDRRYIEVNSERQLAMRIKDEADREAMDLARQAQIYKDEKANQLREQIGAERGRYATKEDLQALADKFDLMHQPVVEFIASQTGRTGGVSASWTLITTLVSFAVGLLVLGTYVFSRETGPVVQPQPQIIYVPAQPGTLIPSPTQGTQVK